MNQRKYRIIILLIVISVTVLVMTPIVFTDVPDTPLPDAEPPVESSVPQITQSSPAPTVPEPSPVTPSPPILQPSPQPTPEPPAVDLTDSLIVSLSDGSGSGNLLDGDYTTKRNIPSNAEITVACDELIYSLYLIWDLPPGEWSLFYEENELLHPFSIYGQDGFLHEFVELPFPVQIVTLAVPDDGAVLCDIYAFSEGYPPDWVQVWLPPLDKADLLVLPTHADDEHLFFVGAMPYYGAHRGYNVQVAYMVNHRNEPERPHELLNGLWLVGIRNYPVIGDFPDYYAETLQDAEARFGRSNIVNYHIGLLRRFKPSVVLGHDLNGEYGHGAHKLNAHALVEAVEKASNADFHEQSALLYGVWDTPKLYLHLYEDNAIIMDWDIPLDCFDGASAREMAVRGYDLHVSQHRWSFSVPPAGSAGSGSRFGLVRSLVGPDVIGGDMFENID